MQCQRMQQMLVILRTWVLRFSRNYIFRIRSCSLDFVLAIVAAVALTLRRRKDSKYFILLRR